VGVWERKHAREETARVRDDRWAPPAIGQREREDIDSERLRVGRGLDSLLGRIGSAGPFIFLFCFLLFFFYFLICFVTFVF
jgi:hypothetical protein